MNKLSRVLPLAIAMMFVGGATFGAGLSNDSVTPGTATENSIYTFQVTWKDDDGRFPLGQSVTQKQISEELKATYEPVPLDERNYTETQATRLYGLKEVRNPFQLPENWTDGESINREIAVTVKEEDGSLYLDKDSFAGTPLKEIDDLSLITYIVGAWQPGNFEEDGPIWRLSPCPLPDGDQETNHVDGQLPEDFLSEDGMRIKLKATAGDSTIEADSVLNIVLYVAWVDNTDGGSRRLDRAQIFTDAETGDMGWPYAVEGVWNEDCATPDLPPGYIENSGQVLWNDEDTSAWPEDPSPKVDRLRGDIILDHPDQGIDSETKLCITYTPRSATEFYLVTTARMSRITRIYRSCTDNPDENLGGSIVDGPLVNDAGETYYLVQLETPMFPGLGVGVDGNLAGTLNVEPVLARFDPNMIMDSNVWRLNKVCYVKNTPILIGGFMGVFASSDTNRTERLDVSYNRLTGKVVLKDSVTVSEPWDDSPVFYYAVYQTGPVFVTVGGDTYPMAEHPDSDLSPKEGITYFVRLSCGLNLANDPTACPGVNYAAGLVSDSDGGKLNTKIKYQFHTPDLSDPTKEIETQRKNGPVVMGSGGYVSIDGLLYVPPSGTITRIGPHGGADNQITMPFMIDDLLNKGPAIEGIYAETVVETPWYFWDNYIGAPVRTVSEYQPGVDRKIDYWPGGSTSMGMHGLRPATIIQTGTALSRVQKLELTPEEWTGTSEIQLWDGPVRWGFSRLLMDPKYVTVRGALLHVAYRIQGVYLKERAPFGTNYFDSLVRVDGDDSEEVDCYDPNLPDVAYNLVLNDTLPANTTEVYVQYVPYVQVHCIPTTQPTVQLVEDNFSVVWSINQARHGTGTNRDWLNAYSNSTMAAWDPLVPETTTTTAGKPPVPNPAGGSMILRRNILKPDAPIIEPDDADAPDEGTGGTPFTFKVAYLHADNRAPVPWLTYNQVPGNLFAWGARTGVVLYLDAKGIGDYQPYFMYKQDPNDNDYRLTDGMSIRDNGVTYVFRVEPADQLSGWYTGDPDNLPIFHGMWQNLYISLLAGRYNYFFGASDDYLMDEKGDPYMHYETPLTRPYSGIWTEHIYSPTRALHPSGIMGRSTNPFIQVDRATLAPGPQTGYPYASSEYPRVHPVLMPPELTADGKIPSNASLLGGAYFYSTVRPYSRMVNPRYDYPPHGAEGHVHGHSGYIIGTDPDAGIWYHGIETTGSTTSTEHTFRIKYQSKHPITGVGIPPAGGVWVFINNASSAGNAGSTRDSGPYVDPTSPYYYRGYRMQPAPGDPLDYAKGVVYELTKITLPAGPHTYYFAASDGNRWARWPVRPDGRWFNKDGNWVFLEDAWVPGDEGWADNNDYCPGPYVNNKPVLRNASVTPITGGQGTTFIFMVNYSDADGQRPHRANLIIELDRNTGLTRTVTMKRNIPSTATTYQESLAEFENGVEYIFSTASGGDMVLTPGEHRFYFEFVDEWGRQTDPNDKIPGEKVRFPQGDGNWITGPIIVENARPTLSRGSVTSGDGGATGATLWAFTVTYADANNDPPSYINLYTGEDVESETVFAEKLTPSKDDFGQYTQIDLRATQVTSVMGVWSAFEDAENVVAATNLYTGASTFDPATGRITIANTLPVYEDNAPADSLGLPKDVYVTYSRRVVKWDAGTSMAKVDPNDNMFTDGCRYEVKMRLGAPEREMLEVPASNVAYSSATSPPTTTIRVNADLVSQVLGVYDNARLEGFDYYNGYVQGEEVLTLVAGSYNATTQAGKLVVRHGPVDPQRIAGVWKNKQATGTNYLDSVDSTDTTGRTLKLKNLPDATGPFYVTYNTLFKGSYIKGDTGWGEIRIRDYSVSASNPLPSMVYVSYVPAAKKYYYAFEASDGILHAVYDPRINSVTQENSLSAGAIEGQVTLEGPLGREYLNPVGNNRFEPLFRGPDAIDPANRDAQGKLVDTVLVGKLGGPGYVVPKDILDDPVIYKTDGKNDNLIKVDVQLQKEFTDTIVSDSTGFETLIDPEGRTMQLPLVLVEEEAWVVDTRRVQLRQGPWSPQHGPYALSSLYRIYVWDYNDRNLDLDRRKSFIPADGATFDADTGIVDMGADVLPTNTSVVWVRYYVWGGIRTEVPDPYNTYYSGVNTVLAIWDDENFRASNFTGFNYWTCHAEKEFVPVQRLAGGIIRSIVAHTPVQRVIGVWDNPNKVGTNYYDDTKQEEFAQGIIYLKSNLPSNVVNVYVDYYAYGDSEFVGQPSVYDPSTGIITLGSPLPAGVRKVWIEFYQKGDYRLNYTGRLDENGAVTNLPCVIFQYTMPVGDPSLSPLSDPDSYKGYIQADYWFAQSLPTKVQYNTPPQLLRGQVTPLEGRSNTDFVFTVDYRDTDGPTGQPPSYVRVIIDGGQAIDMQPVLSGTPSYRDGARYRHLAKLRGGSHSYHFEASDGAGFAFFGNTGSTASNIIPLPGPWVNDPPVLSDPSAAPNPPEGRLSTLDTVEYVVTYTDVDNDAPDTDIQTEGKALDPGFPKLWIDNRDRIAYYGTIDSIILEDGAEYDPQTEPNPVARARKIKFSLQAGPGQLTPPTFGVDTFAGKYLQITSGSLKGRVYYILNNTRDVKSTTGGLVTYNDYITVVASDIVEEGVSVGTAFVIGPVTMTKDGAQTDFTKGIQYKTTIPRLAPGDHNFHMTAQSTAYIPLNIGQAFSPPLVTAEQRKRTQFAVPTSILNGPSVEVVGPEGNVAPELSGAVWTQDPINKEIWTFKVNYKDQDGHAPTFNETERVLGYVRLIITAEDGAKLMVADMYPQSWNVDFKSPVQFTTNNIRILTGRKLFYFEASDGWQVVTLRSPDFYTVINSPPALRDASVNPPTGNEWTSFFEYKVNYYDPDGKQNPSVRLYIDNSSTGILMEVERDSNGNLPPDTAYGDPTRGVNYVKKVTKSMVPGLFVPGNHKFGFVASDGIDQSEPLTNQSGPVITENKNAPQLIPFQIMGVDVPCDPTEGNLTRSYTYKIYYRDDDGDAPLVIDQNGVVTTGIVLFIDRSTTNPNPGADPLGYLMKVDPNWKGPAENSVPTTDDFKSAEGVLYSRIVSGKAIGAGADHYAWFMAWDGKLDGTARANEAKVKLNGPSIRAASITGLTTTPSPGQIGSSVTISGKLNPIMPDSRDRYVYFKLTRPDGTRFDLGDNSRASCDASTGAFTMTFVPDSNRNWKAEISWPGNAEYEKTAESYTFEVRMEPYVVKELSDGTPVIDMIACPLVPTNGIPDTLFGPDEARQMRIQRWDPGENIYFRFGETYFPPLIGGDGMWIYPTLSYPKNGKGAFNEPIRVISPFGRLHPQNTAFRLPIRRGWNQIGSVFLSNLPITNIKVRHQNGEISLSEAAAAGMIRDYCWGWDALRNPSSMDNYFLVHATREGAQRSLRPWQGYWIKAFVDTELILHPPNGGIAALMAVPEDAGPAANRNWEGLDRPPASP